MSDYIYGSSLRAAKSKANYLFEGDFRRRPNQNLAGASRSLTGVELLQRAAEHRQNREDTRRKDIASIKIQSAWRGHCVRVAAAKQMRRVFDNVISNLENGSQRVTRRSASRRTSITPEVFDQIYREFIVHCNSIEDKQRFDSLIDLMMKQPSSMFPSKNQDHMSWFYRLCRLMKFNLKLIERQSLTDDLPEENLDRYLNFMEYYSRVSEKDDSPLSIDEASHLWRSLINIGLFKIMRRLADHTLNLLPPNKSESRRNLIIEVLRRSLDVEHSISGGDKAMPVFHLFEQFFHGPIEPNLEKWYFLVLLDLEPRQLKPKELLRGFANSHRLMKYLPQNSAGVPLGFPASSFTSQLYTMPVFSNQADALNYCKDTIWLCYMFLRALYTRIDQFDETDKIDYINIVSILIAPAEYITNISLIQAANEDNDEQNEDDPSDESLTGSVIFHKLNHYHEETHSVISKIIELFNKMPHINSLKPIIFNSSDQIQTKVRSAIVQICNLMLSHEYLAIFNCRLLYTIAFSKEFSRSLWQSIVTATSDTIFGTKVPIYQQVCKGNSISHESWRLILPKLKLFCCLCSYLLPTLGDDEFYTMNQNHFSLDETMDNEVQMYEDGRSNIARATSSSDRESNLQRRVNSNRNETSHQQNYSSSSVSGIGGFYVDRELVGISAILRDICIGLIEIIYQGNKHNNASTSSSQSQFVGNFDQKTTSGFQDEKSHLLVFEIKSCFQALVRLVCQLHARDSRKQFCPDGHWICPSVVIPANKAIDFQLVTSQQGRLMKQLTKYEQVHQERMASISSEIKTVLILQEIPFVVSFHDRVQIFHQLLRKERQIHQPEGYHFGLAGSAISVQIRRNYIYEDAFEELSFDNEPNMKLPLKVSLINAVGAEEAGIDGGGLTKEFLSELLKTGFDPMRGFFKYTKDHFLYPNPSSNVLFATSPEGYEVHFEFLGRMLGKAVFEKIMVELPLAGFFLAKLLAVKHSSDVDLHNLESLDPVLYKNLVYLKNYKGDVADLDLDFTISNNDLGEHEMVELKPGGSKISVTRENKIEYVHLVADYRLNKQIRVQCAAFKRGLSQLIDLDWLRMFDPRELQILISGAPTVIDVADWRRHTVYGHGYTDSSEAVQTFWTVVQQLDESQKRKLLKFATSCSLPPLLGFKDLVPQFSIAPAEEERLPTASTCMNLLKLPECQDEEAMRTKVLYAIESNSGFELS